MRNFLPIRRNTLLLILLCGVCMSHTHSYAYSPSQDTMIFLPEGTRILIKLRQPLSSEYTMTGSYFDAEIATDVTYQGQTMIPAGNWVQGIVMESGRARNLGGRSRLALELSDIELGEWILPVLTDQLGFVGQGSDTGLKTGAGAVIGAVISGWKGLVKGAAVGLGISAVTSGEQIYLQAGMILEFYLAEPVLIESDQL